jgi:PelA/Pel-15E family pectate lyase
MKSTLGILMVIVGLLNLATADAKAERGPSPELLKLNWSHVATRMPDEWYGSEEAKIVADSVLKYQTPIGGWPKNSGFHRGINQEEWGRIKASGIGATFDNGATLTEMMFLARIYEKIKDERYRKAFYRAFDYIFESQYENGGWPQFFPYRKNKSAYSSHITYNDDVMVSVLFFLRDVINENELLRPMKITKKMRNKAKKAYDKGIDCILKTQIVVNGKLTAWCAQHDEFTLAPAMARSYELPSISGGESVGIVRFLMGIENPSKEVINAIEGAITWFENAKITGIRLERILGPSFHKGYDLVVVKDPTAPPVWARFYEIGTNRPMFVGRDGVVKNKLSEIEQERRSGYNYYMTGPGKLLEEDYPKWKNKMGS